MPRPNLKVISAMTPAELAMQREAEARELTAQEARAIEADARALLARCDQYARLNNTHAGFRHATVELAHALRLKVPVLTATLTVAAPDDAA